MLRFVYFFKLVALKLCNFSSSMLAYVCLAFVRIRARFRAIVYLTEINLFQNITGTFCLSFMCERIFEDFSKSLFLKSVELLSACFFLNTSNICYFSLLSILFFFIN